MKKLTKCKACGEEIAKSAKACPHCGARQHRGVAVLCAIIIIIAIAACVGVIAASSGDDKPQQAESGSTGANSPSAQESVSSDPATSSAASENQVGVIFDGSYATIAYAETFEADGVSGCFYINLQIENKSESEIWVYLEDVYVDDLSCTSGTGLPVTVLPEKKTNGSFIVFCDGSLDSVEKVEFKVVVADNETATRLETSDTLKIFPAA